MHPEVIEGLLWGLGMLVVGAVVLALSEWSNNRNTGGKRRRD